LLGVEHIGRHDNFFELGGHSLLTVQLLARIRTEFEVEIAIHQLFSYPTICLFGELIIDAQLLQFDVDSLRKLNEIIKAPNHRTTLNFTKEK
ncbi:phosphopantetheine-binding protein, partial [Photorhabdus bodei]